MSDKRISDDEILYRRIRLASSWFQSPDRITSANFKLKPDEIGVSVYRAGIVDAANVLNRPEVKCECRVAAATAGQIRAAKNGKGEPLNLDVVPVNDENDPGHAEIRGPVAGKISNRASKTLSGMFRLIDSTASTVVDSDSA